MSYAQTSQEAQAFVLQRCDQFVGRTTNWLYDHLRFVPRYSPIVLCDVLTNREEFSLLQARQFGSQSLMYRAWRRVAGTRLSPGDWCWLKRLKPRLLHSHFGYVAVDDLPLARTLARPWVVSFYGADLYQLGSQADWQAHYARVFEHVTAVLALGPTMAAGLERLGCPKEKVVIHPLGVDVRELPSAARVLHPGEPLKILFAGTYREKKGLHYLIQAAALARDARVRLELHLVGDAMAKAGDQETKDGVLREIRALNLDACVTHYPLLRFEELLRLALRCHIFVAPSVTATDGDAEGTPFVLQQMMATAMPAIATTHSDIPYVFGEYQHLLVPERDAKAIAERLRHYAEAPDQLVAEGMALRDRVRHAFDVRACAARLSELYDLSMQS